MPEFKFQVNDFTIIQFIKNETYIDIAKGMTKERMSRGSYTSKERFLQKSRLFYSGVIDGNHCFKNKDLSLNIKIEPGNPTTLIFEEIPGYNRLWITLKAKKDEHIYGCGEQFTHLNLKGQSVPIWVSEHHSVKKLIAKYIREKFKSVDYAFLGKYKDHASYYAQPTFISSQKYAVHVDSYAYAQFTFSETETVLYFREIPQKLHFIKADSYIELSQSITKLIGLQNPLPEWTSKGIILAIQGGVDVIETKLKKAEKNGLKVAGVWAQDWSGQTITKFGEQVYWNWTLDEKRYHDLKEKIKAWNKQNIYFLGYINPFLKEHSPQFKEALKENFLVKRKSKKPYLMKSTTFKAGLVDLTNPNAFTWMKEIIKKEMISLGMSGWMADFGEYLPTDALLYQGDPKLIHNQYPELWAKCNAEAIQESQSNSFFFSRAAYTKTLKYTNAMWTGDQHVDYSDQYGLGSVIPALLSMAISGVGINHTDTGGYTTIFHMKRDPELMVRWAELAMFSPLFRTHEGNLPKRNVQFDDNEVIPYFKTLTQLYDRLSFYHEETKKQYYEQGIPTIRPLFYHFQDAYALTTKKQFMYGDSLLVSPVLRPNTQEQTIQLPHGRWVHLMTKKIYEGGIHTVKTPLGVPCAFYLESSKHKSEFDKVSL